MNVMLLRALAASIPACLLLCGSLVFFFREKAVSRVLQVVGAGGLVLVVLSHVCEALRLWPWMGWGLENSLGHYLDLSGAVLGVALFPTGYLLDAIAKQPASGKKPAV